MNKRSRIKRWTKAVKILINRPQMIYSKFLDSLYEENILTKIPLKSFETVSTNKDQIIKLQYINSDIQGITITELCILNWITAHFAPENIFEFGTADGQTTLNLAINSPELCHIYTIDLPRDDRLTFYQLERAAVGENQYILPFKESVGKYFSDHSLSTKITQIFGDSTKYDYSSFIKKMDLIFIDANHEYKFVKSDSENALKMLSDRGVLIWHDYPSWMGVYKYINEIYDAGYEVFKIRNTTLACYSTDPNINKCFKDIN